MRLIPRIYIIVAIVSLAMCGSAKALKLPTDEEVSGILKLCSLGESRRVAGDLKGAINLWKHDAQVTGEASMDDLGGILAKLPVGQQIDPQLYAQIRQCIRDEISDFMKSSKNECNDQKQTCNDQLVVKFDRCIADQLRKCIIECVTKYGYDEGYCHVTACNSATLPQEFITYYEDRCRRKADYLEQRASCVSSYQDCLANN
jgi:hypothetical protein